MLKRATYQARNLTNSIVERAGFAQEGVAEIAMKQPTTKFFWRATYLIPNKSRLGYYRILPSVFSVAIVVVGLMPPVRGAETSAPPTNAFAKNLSQLKEIQYVGGLNTVHFDGLGSDAQIMFAETAKVGAKVMTTWVYMALAPIFNSQQPVIPFVDRHGGEQYTVTALPYDIDNAAKTVRFFNGLFDNKPSTFVFVASRDLLSATPAPTQVTAYVLKELPDGGDFYFATAAQFIPKAKYCKPDVALKVELGVPLPFYWYPGGMTAEDERAAASYHGNGCPPA